MKRLYILLLFGTLLIGSCKSIQLEDKSDRSILKNSKQLIVVTTPNWNSRFGTLKRYEKMDNRWQRVGKVINVVIGRAGLGWGLGLHVDSKICKIC